MSSMLSLLSNSPVVPVITIEDLESAVPLARALVAGGLSVLEITLRTPCAMAAIERICDQVPEAVAGAGTVTRAEDFSLLKDLGAQFAISPGATPALYEAAADSGLPFLPGIASASELMQGLERGYDCFKFFPANAIGGVVALRALYGPFPNARFCPTGGITEETLSDYLSLPNVVAAGGSWFAPAADVAAGRWELITERARRIVGHANPG